MGWQGRMRDAKGRRIWAMIPEAAKAGLTFYRVSCWRDDDACYASGRAADGRMVTIRVKRATGELYPLRPGENPIQSEAWSQMEALRYRARSNKGLAAQ